MTQSTSIANIVLLIPEITRGMKSIGSKSLLNINMDLTILDYQILYIKKYYKNTPIKIITGLDHEKVEKKAKKYNNIDFHYIKNYEASNQAQSVIEYIKTFKPRNFLLINNGVLLKEKLNVQKDTKSYLYLLPKKRDGFNIGSSDENNIKYLFYDLEYKWSECVFFDESTVNKMLVMSKIKKFDNLFLFELINILIDENTTIESVLLDNQKNIYKINNLEDIKKAKKFI